MIATPAVVLLHGWGGTFASTWTATGWPAALAAADHCLIEIDLPGHGRPAPIDPVAYNDLVTLLDEMLPAGTLDVVGFSLGAKLTLALAARRPGRFRRIVLGGVGDNLFAPEPNGEMVAAALIDGVPNGAPPAVAGLVRYAGVAGNDPRALAAVLRRPPNPIVAEPDLARVGDVLLVNGDADVVAMPDTRLRAALASVRAVRLPGVDHLSLPASDEFRRIALEYLKAGPSQARELP